MPNNSTTYTEQPESWATRDAFEDMRSWRKLAKALDLAPEATWRGVVSEIERLKRELTEAQAALAGIDERLRGPWGTDTCIECGTTRLILPGLTRAGCWHCGSGTEADKNEEESHVEVS